MPGRWNGRAFSVGNTGLRLAALSMPDGDEPDEADGAVDEELEGVVDAQQYDQVQPAGRATVDEGGMIRPPIHVK